MSLAALPEPELDRLAREVRAEVALAHRDIRSGIERIIHVGVLLTQAKTHFKHGEWLPWLETTGLSARQAQKYMRLAEIRPEGAFASINKALEAVADGRAQPVHVPDKDPGEQLVDRAYRLVSDLLKAPFRMRTLTQDQCRLLAGAAEEIIEIVGPPGPVSIRGNKMPRERAPRSSLASTRGACTPLAPPASGACRSASAPSGTRDGGR